MSNVRIACNPDHNVVVEACAGSGKTWLLTARIFRLLLAGAQPSEILAITFTRKAALEMRERLTSLLIQCMVCPDLELESILVERGVIPTAELRQRARSLAGVVLTSMQGVAIDTFHGWFASLCQMAPLGCGFSRQAEPSEQTALIHRLAINRFLEFFAQSKASISVEQDHLQQQFAVLSSQWDTPELLHMLSCTLVHRVSVSLWLNCFDRQSFIELFAIDHQNWPSCVLQSQVVIDNLHIMAKWLGQGTSTQQKKAVEIETLLTEFQRAPESAEHVFEQLCQQIFTEKGKGSLAKNKITQLQQEKAGINSDDYDNLWLSIGQAMQMARAKAVDARDYTWSVALFAVAPILFNYYEEVKHELGVCDFDDLEETAFQLLAHEDQRVYLLEKLDRRVRHVLIDEFQDTNPIQWGILRLWLQEYDLTHQPTVFLVGDPKQSIYRFRRAESRLFNYVKDWLQTHFSAQVLESDDTRRCCPEVVDLVNSVLVNTPRLGKTQFRQHGCLSSREREENHFSLLVYPLVRYAKNLPDDEVHVTEAEFVARTLQQFKLSGKISRYGQVLVLVKSHQSAHKLAPVLRQYGIGYQLKDIGERYQSLVWSDTLALFSWLNSTTDSASLLQLLRSPLLQIQTHELTQLLRCMNELGCDTVWRALAHLALHELWASTVYARLNDWHEKAQRLPLFDVIFSVVEETQASVKYLNATPSAQRILFAEHWEWLKSWCLQVNSGRYPNLNDAIEQVKVLATYGGSEGEQGETDESVVRILTVHSAKGLEADHVWLFDACQENRPSGSSLNLLIDWPLGELAPRGITVVNKDSCISPSRQSVFETEQQAQLDEEDHLLYVALTRARVQIHLSGTTNHHGHSGGWYSRLLPHARETTWPETEMQTSQSTQEVKAWIRKYYPINSAFTQQVGVIQSLTASDEQLMGNAFHAVLEQIDQYFLCAHFDEFWQNCWLDCEPELFMLNTEQLQQVKQSVALVLNNAQIQTWFKHVNQSYSEIEWVNQAGQLARADKVIQTDQGWLVLDYKWSVNTANQQQYVQQVQHYMQLLQATLIDHSKKEQIQGALIDRMGHIHWVSSV